jgi:TM2 domain-containing membrane protein YozV
MKSRPVEKTLNRAVIAGAASGLFFSLCLSFFQGAFVTTPGLLLFGYWGDSASIVAAGICFWIAAGACVGHLAVKYKAAGLDAEKRKPVERQILFVVLAVLFALSYLGIHPELAAQPGEGYADHDVPLWAGISYWLGWPVWMLCQPALLVLRRANQDAGVPDLLCGLILAAYLYLLAGLILAVRSAVARERRKS